MEKGQRLSWMLQSEVYRAVLVYHLQPESFSCCHEMALCFLLCHPSVFASHTFSISIAVMSDLCLMWSLPVKAVKMYYFSISLKETFHKKGVILYRSNLFISQYVALIKAVITDLW